MLSINQNIVNDLKYSASILIVLFLILPKITFAQGPTNWKDRYVTLASQNDYAPQIARPDTGSRVVIVWEQNDSQTGYNIYAQLLEITHGLPRWDGDGVVVCNASGDQRNPRAAYDQSGGVIITWEDNRGNQSDIYAQRMDLYTGRRDDNWSSNGISICSNSGKPSTRPRIVGTGDGAFITWTDTRTGLSPTFVKKNVYAQYVNCEGSIQWTSNGVRVNQDTSSCQQNPELVLDKPPQANETPGIIVVWEDARNDVWQLYAQLLDSHGSAQWGNSDVHVAPTYYNQRNHQLAQDASVTSGTPTGPVIVWQDYRNSNNPDIYVQQLSTANSGEPQWPNANGDGLAVCTATGNQRNPVLTYIVNALVAWEDTRDSTNTGIDIYAGLINVDNGNVVTSSPWSSNGRTVSTASNDQKNIAIGTYNFSGYTYAVIGWQDARNGSGTNDIYAQQFVLSSPYSYIWQSNGWPITEAKGEQTLPQLSRDVFVFEDGRRSDKNIYAQRIGGEQDGYTIMSYRDMFAKWTFDSPASKHQIITDAYGNCFVVWQEMRSASVYATSKIYIQKFDSTGVPLWTNNGYLVSNPADDATDPDIAVDFLNDGIFVTFLADGDVIVKRYADTTGATWTETIQHGNDTFTEPKVVDDDAGHAIVAWIKNAETVVMKRPDQNGWEKSKRTPSAQGLILKKDKQGGCYTMWKSSSDKCTIEGVDVISNPSPTLLTQYTFNPANADNIEKYDMVVDIYPDGGFYRIFAVASTNTTASGKNDIWFLQLISDGTNINIAPTLGYLNLSNNTSFNSYSPKVTVDGIKKTGNNNGGAIVVWSTVYGASSNRMVETQRVESDNTPHWSPHLIVSSGNFYSEKPVVDLVSEKYAMVVWEDSRTGGRNTSGMITLYTQLIDPTGSDSASALKWVSDGKVVSEPAGGSETVPIIKNSFGETIKERGSATIFWLDERSDTTCVIGTRKIPDSEGTLMKEIVIKSYNQVPQYMIELKQNYPNPCGSGLMHGSNQTTIKFILQEDASVSLAVYDIFGREKKTILEGKLPGGVHLFNIEVNDLPSGTYFYRLKANDKTITRRMMITR